MVVESPRAPVRQACDVCRLRKIKCEPLTGHEAAGSTTCKPCFGGKLDCTYIMPVKRRGPPPKRRRIIVEPDDHNRSPSATAADDRLSTSLGKRDPMSIQSIISASPDSPTSIKQICSQAVFDTLMKDYLDIIYPLVPVVHRPTFRADLRNERQTYDETFQSFCLAICALVLVILPRKLDLYRQIDGSLPFQTRKEAVTAIHSLILKNRTIEYFDTVSHEKWAIAYMIATTSAHLQNKARSGIQFAETSAMCSELGLNRIASYSGLNAIEIQLRKKAFWLNFTTYSHVRAHEVQWDSLGDRFIFDSADAELLMPLDVDDEYITAQQVHPQPQGRTSLTVGFNALNYINNCLVTIIKDPLLPLLSCTEPTIDHRSLLQTCVCGRHVKPASIAALVQARLEKTRPVLDHLPDELRPWSSNSEPSLVDSSTDAVLFSQYESMKANIHVTHLWVQSILFERYVACRQTSSTSNPAIDCPSEERIWEMREDICRQLLHLLNNISQANLEPNGHFLIMKTREVASSLLDCPLEEEDHFSHRAKAYIQSFADILARLDNAYQNDYRQNLWEELDEQAREPPSAFWPLPS